MVIFGSVTTKPSGSLPPVACASVVRNRSSVRAERGNSSSEKVLMRMPMKGGSVRCILTSAAFG